MVMPSDVGAALRLAATSGRARAEVRAGLGGTYTALGAWALANRSAAACSAVGFTWLGAGAVRIASLALDRPRTDRAFWLYLMAELGLGTAAVRNGRTAARVTGLRAN